QHATLVLGRRWRPTFTPSGHLGVVDVQIDALRGDVYPDAVAVPDEGDGAAVDRLGGDVTDAQPGRPAGEAAVSDEQHVLAQAGTLDGAGDGEHLAHARPALRALVADDHDVVRAQLTGGDSFHRRSFAVEHPRRPVEHVGVESGGLDHGAVRRE